MSVELDFAVRIGIPGALTIEVQAVPTLIGRPTNIFAPLNQPVLSPGDMGTATGYATARDIAPKLISKGWGQGWAVPMSQRGVALGFNTGFQLISFEAPSWDQTDNLWGATGTIDAATDPVTFQATLFGESVYGRAFAVGDYVLWDDPASANGRYQYEIDQITAVNGNAFTLARSGPFGGGGTAQFGSVKAAHAGVNFYQLIDKVFFSLWEGEWQVYKFLWDQMIVCAVSITTVGITRPSLRNLFSIPPAPAAPGVTTGSADLTATNIASPIGGGVPLTPSGLPTSGTPIPPSTPVVAALPGPSDPLSVVGNTVVLNGIPYVFTAGLTAPPGFWQQGTVSTPTIRDTHANRVNYPAANYPLGTVYYETDTIVEYAVQLPGGVNTWLYFNGIFEDVLANIPVGLGPEDISYTFRASDYKHSYRWTGTAWSRLPGGLGPGTFLVVAQVFYLPDGLWQLCDGSTVPVSQNDATLVNETTPIFANQYLLR